MGFYGSAHGACIAGSASPELFFGFFDWSLCYFCIFAGYLLFNRCGMLDLPRRTFVFGFWGFFTSGLWLDPE
jgi:hypothetical protein